jgi:hypothetical protein
MLRNVKYSSVSDSAIGIAVKSDYGWWDWAKKEWTGPFKAADHVQKCQRDPERPRVQEQRIPAEACVSGAYAVDGVMETPGQWVELGTITGLDYYLLPGRGSIGGSPI